MSLSNLNKRLKYLGGKTSESRFQADKLKSLKKALFNSYQAETIILEDGREFRCLINKNALSEDYNDKIISIPFSDICLNKDRVGTTTEGIEEIGLKCGDIFEWKGTGTFWLVYLRYLEEDSYFRAEIRKCDGDIEIGDSRFKAYIKGPAESDLNWSQKEGLYFNQLNYSLMAFVQKTDEALDYFHRFKQVKIKGDNWKVTAINPYYAEGIIKVWLAEDFNNTLVEKAQEVEEPDIPVLPPEDNSPYINGKDKVYPYDIVTYSIENASGGQWKINNKKAKIVESTELTVTLEIVTGKSGDFELSYEKDNNNIFTSKIKILSL